MLAILGGTSLLECRIFSGWPEETVKTPFGAVTVKKGDEVAFLQRHGNPPMPPHRIGHRTNIAALKELGVRRIVAVNSVGSLRFSLEPGTLLVPNDFVSPWHIETFFDDEMRFMIPVMDGNFAHEVFLACREHTMAVHMGGTYVQTIGPRLETKAEINILKGFGDIVGMTLASEATLAMEMDLPYASICSIDNYCHGIVEVPLTMDEIRANVSRNLSTIENVLNSIITRGIS